MINKGLAYLVITAVFLSLWVLAFCWTEPELDKLSYDKNLGIWTYPGGSLQPLYNSLPRNDIYNAPADKANDIKYQVAAYEPRNSDMEENRYYKQLQTGASDYQEERGSPSEEDGQ